MDPSPWVRSGGPVGHPPKAGAFGRSPGSRENPWAFFGYFLSQQKVTPRRGGETSQKISKTRQECEGADRRVAVKRKRDYEITKAPYSGPRDRHVQEAALRACLEDQADKPASAWRSPRLGNGRSRYRPRFVTSHRRKKGRNMPHPFLMPYFLPRPVMDSCCL